MSRSAYTHTAAVLHWVHAALVLGMITLGLYMVDLPKGDLRHFVFGIHKSFGLIAIGLIAVRLTWRLGHEAPPNPVLAPWERRLADATHKLLYGLLVLVPAAGFTSISFTKYPLKFFGIPVPKPGFPDETLNAFFSGTHRVLAWTLIAVVTLHIAAAIRHGLRRDGTLRRMLPWHRPRVATRVSDRGTATPN